MKEKLLEALFESYYNDQPNTQETEDAKLALCENCQQERILFDAIKVEAEKAYKEAFNSALALMGGVQ